MYHFVFNYALHLPIMLKLSDFIRDVSVISARYHFHVCN